MKKNKHPERREVLFVDAGDKDAKFAITVPVGGAVADAISSGQEEDYKDRRLPVVPVRTSSRTHAAYRPEEEAPRSSKAEKFRDRYKEKQNLSRERKEQEKKNFTELKNKLKKKK